MTPDRTELETRFRDMSDDELLEHASSGDLTDLAQQVADSELAARGLETPERPGPPVAEEVAAGALQIVGIFVHPIAAEALKVRLMAEGLSPVTHYANGGVFGNVGNAGVRVLVPESQLAEAERIHKAMEAGEFSIDEDFDVGR